MWSFVLDLYEPRQTMIQMPIYHIRANHKNSWENFHVRAASAMQARLKALELLYEKNRLEFSIVSVKRADDLYD